MIVILGWKFDRRTSGSDRQSQWDSTADTATEAWPVWQTNDVGGVGGRGTTTGTGSRGAGQDRTGP